MKLTMHLSIRQGWTGTKVWPWTFWSRLAHYNLHADIEPTRPVDVHTNTQVLNNTTILNNVPLYSEALFKINDNSTVCRSLALKMDTGERI